MILGMIISAIIQVTTLVGLGKNFDVLQNCLYSPQVWHGWLRKCFHCFLPYYIDTIRRQRLVKHLITDEMLLYSSKCIPNQTLVLQYLLKTPSKERSVYWQLQCLYKTPALAICSPIPRSALLIRLTIKCRAESGKLSKHVCCWCHARPNCFDQFPMMPLILVMRYLQETHSPLHRPRGEWWKDTVHYRTKIDMLEQRANLLFTYQSQAVDIRNILNVVSNKTRVFITITIILLWLLSMTKAVFQDKMFHYTW